YLGSGYTNTITAENPTFRQPPTQLASGLLSAPSAGLMEFDGTAFYGTSVASSRQVTTTKQITVLSTANTLSNSSTSAQNIFPTGQATL
ncbi:hypothetical protein, partial [Klebsiella michiganensis]|uniref:hypothetical protein n=1 Tax=Klebsiella michiganensis TaxID=1134687 RepID=UPI0019537E64